MLDKANSCDGRKDEIVSIATRDMDVWLVIVKQLTTLTQISYIAVSGNRI